LLKTINLANSESIGIIEKEKHLALYLKSGEKEINCDNLKLYINNNNVDYTILENRDFSIIMDIKIPESIANTILSWNEYREKEGNYFSIDFSSIGERIEEPNQLKIEFYSNGEKNEKTIFFDTIDSYKYNMNYTFNNGVIDENINKIKVKEWLL
jgi:hypothetical protein